MQFNIISPSLAMLGGLGSLLAVENVLTLFKLSMVLDSLFFAFSMLLLVDYLLPHSRHARSLVLFGALLTNSWMVQPFLNFYVFYALPLVIYLLLRFLDQGQARFFWAAGAVEILSIFGNVAYFAPLHFWGLLLLFLPTLLSRPKVVLAIFGKGFFIPMSGVLVLLLTSSYFALHSLDYLAFLTDGRQLDSGEVSLHNFLNHGRGTLANVAIGITTGGFLHFDNTYYMGLLPLALFVYGFVTNKGTFFSGLTLTILALYSLSVGGELATLMFHYLPGFHLFRHVGQVYGIIKILVLLAAGLVIQDFVSGHKIFADNKTKITCWLVLCVAVMDTWLSWRPYDHTLLESKSEFMLGLWWWAFSIRLLLYGLIVGWLWQHTREIKLQLAPGLLLLVYFIDVAMFQAQVVVTSPMTSVDLPKETFLQRPISYIPVRYQEFIQTSLSPSVLNALLNRTDIPYLSEPHDTLYPLIGMDSCFGLRTSLVYSSGILEMIRLRGGNPKHYSASDFLPANDAGLLQTLGCYSAKLLATRLVTIAANRQEAARLFAQLPDPGHHLILLAGNQPLANLGNEPVDAPPPVNIKTTITHFSANRLSVTVDSHTPHPFWLHYADANHPAWHATVNGKEVPIAISQFALKAIPLQGKHNNVTLEFRPGLMGSLAWITAIFTTLAGMGMVFFMIWVGRITPSGGARGNTG